MDLKIKGKTALVTGSTAGIGFSIASLLAQEGARVVVNGRTQERVDAAMAQIRKQTPGADLLGMAADVGQASDIKRLVQSVPDVDILVNNTGIFEAKPFEKIPDEEWLRFFEVNVMSGVRLSRAFLPGMIKKNWGRIVFISSESALNIPAEMIHYGLTKTAQLALSRGLAETTAGTGVTVNAVLPGPTRSEGLSGYVRDLAKAQKTSESVVEENLIKTMRPSSLLKRFATTDEVAAMVVYVCSALASATNGAALRVDGGVVRSIT